MVRAGDILACYQTRKPNPCGFRDLLCYLYQCNTSEEHSELGGGICTPWAQTQPRAVARWKQNLTGDRAPLPATMAAAFIFYVKTALLSDMLQPAFKLWGLGIGFLKILLKFFNLRRSTCFRSFASCQLMPTLSNTQAGVSQEKAFVKLYEKHNSSTKYFLYTVSSSCHSICY